MRAIIFNQQNMTAADLGLYANTFANRRTGIIKGLTMSRTNMNINIASGQGLVCGRMFAVDGTDTVAVSEVTSGTKYCRLVCEVDLSKTSTAQACNQIYWRVLENNSAYPTLTQQDLTDYPTTGVYQMPMAKFTVSAGGIANWVDERPIYDIYLTGTLTAGSTTLVISDSSITTNSLYDIYTSNWSCQPEEITVTNGSMTLTFLAQDSNVTIKVRIL